MNFRGGGAPAFNAPQGFEVCAEVKNSALNQISKTAFTLAEVLITLGIIGIVAAMTLPNLIGNYQKKQTATQLKKVYSLIQQAVRHAEADYENIEYWNFDLTADQFKDTYIKPYFKVVKEYKSGEFPGGKTIYCRDGKSNCTGYSGFSHNPKLILADGTLLSVESLKPQKMVNIVVDLNGFKKPNRYGRDVFFFTIQPKSGVSPYGVNFIHNDETKYSYDREFLLNGNNQRSCRNDGIFCAGVIMMDDWEIKDDYPWN